MSTFVPFPKVPRLSRHITITEKIDGTNSCIKIFEEFEHCSEEPVAVVDGWHILAGSRKRWILPNGDGRKGTDNFGFAGWVRDNAEELVKLGHGTHFGEWWGMGIQRNYGLKEKRFSLFNTSRWIDSHDGPGAPVYGLEVAPACCHVVPVIFEGEFDKMWSVYDRNMSRLRDMPIWEQALNDMKYGGSHAAPEFMKPEGIMIFHHAANQIFKKTIEDDDKGKEWGS